MKKKIWAVGKKKSGHQQPGEGIIEKAKYQQRQ